MAWFRKRHKEAPPVEKMQLRGIFFLSSVVLVVLTYWMLFDEARPRRPWKFYQIEFNRLEYRMAQDELKAAEQALAAKDAEVKALEGELKRAEAAAEGPEGKRLQERKAALEKALAPVSEKVAFTKASLDEANYVVEKALYDAGGNRGAPDYQKALKVANGIEEGLAKVEPEEARLTREVESVEAELHALQAAAQKTRDKLSELRTPVVNLQRRLEGIKGRIPEIQQVVIEGLDLNEFKEPILRVDRCMTCHVGAGRAGFEKEKLEEYHVPPHLQKVFMTHPYREALIGRHPTAQYGCSVCHQGQPPALDVDDAHATVLSPPKPVPAEARASGAEAATGGPTAGAKFGPATGEAKSEPGKKVATEAKAAAGHGEERHFYWERPLFRGELLQASCRRCHADQEVIPLAPVYSEGRALVADLGCFGCHNIRGFEKAEKVAPILTKVREKVDPSWLVRWIKNPKAFRPETKMPVFKNGPGENDFMTDDEVTSIAAYLLKHSTEDPQQRGLSKGGSAEKGKALVRTLGCLGCHHIDGLQPAAQPAASPGQATPSGAASGQEAQQPPAAGPPSPAEAKPEAGKPSEAKPAAGGEAEAGKGGEAKAAGPERSPEPAKEAPGAKPAAPVDEKAAAQARIAAIVAVKPSPPPSSRFAPDLSSIAAKAKAEWVYRWLLNPKAYNPKTRMPSLRLSEEEAADITAFLMTLGRKSEIPGLAAKLNVEAYVKEGERLIRKRGCFGCHDIQGFETAEKIAPDLTSFSTKRLLEMFFGEAVHVKQTWEDFTLNKLLNPQIYQTERVQQIMPNFKFTVEQAKALRVFLKAQNDDRAPKAMTKTLSEAEDAIQEGRRLVRRYNCDGCHRIESLGGAIAAFYEGISLAPPPLVQDNLQEGEKVQSTWLYEWLARPTRVRPWLQVRMPTFGLNIDEATALTKYFGALANVRLPYEFVLARDIPPEMLEAGRRLTGKDYFDCFSCHVQGEKKPEGSPEGWAPDLALARYRLRPAWIEKWLHDPQKIQPGTKMPSFFSDTEGIPDDILKDPKDPDKRHQLDRQIHALRDYVMSLGER